MICAACLMVACTSTAAPLGPYAARVRECLDTLIEHGTDRYGNTHTPLLCSILDVETRDCPQNPCNRSRAGRGLVHFSAKQRYFHRKTMPENMDLSPYRPKGTVPFSRRKSVNHDEPPRRRENWDSPP